MSQIREIKEANDIVEIIGERVNLKKTGVNYRGLCPFHSEKTPSFFVSEEMQRFKCFGCGASGDVYTFLQQYEGMTFYEALQYLADRAGIKLKKIAKTPEDDQREQIFQALDLAAEYYHYLLTKHQVGHQALAYLKQRQINQSSIKLFKLGYAQAKWDGLINYLHGKKKLPLTILVKAGLIIKGKYDRYYDRFRNRLMFPLRDHRGRVVGFSGRVLNKVKEAKYINTPETLVYHKRQLLYGLAELRSQIKKADKVIVVEGELDVIASQQAQVNNVVAIKGSALTKEHALLLKRLTEVVLLSLDADAAGVKATQKAITVLKEFDLELRVIPLVAGKDPADLVKLDPHRWREMTKQSLSAYEFLIQAALKKYDITNAQGKKKVMKELALPLWGIESKIEREYYLKKLATSLDVSLSNLSFDLKRFATKEMAAHPSPKDHSQPTETKNLSRLAQLERWTVMLLSVAPSNILGQLIEDLREIEQLSSVSSWFHQLIGAMLTQSQSTKSTKANRLKINLGRAARSLSEDRQQIIFDILADPKLLRLIEKIEFDKEWQKIKLDLESALLHQKRSQIIAELNQLEHQANKADIDLEKERQLLMQLAKLQSKT